MLGCRAWWFQTGFHNDHMVYSLTSSCGRSCWNPLILSDLNFANVLVIAVISFCFKFAFSWLPVNFEQLHLFICYSNLLCCKGYVESLCCFSTGLFVFILIVYISWILVLSHMCWKFVFHSIYFYSLSF